MQHPSSYTLYLLNTHVTSHFSTVEVILIQRNPNIVRFIFMENENKNRYQVVSENLTVSLEYWLPGAKHRLYEVYKVYKLQNILQRQFLFGL